MKKFINEAANFEFKLISDFEDGKFFVNAVDIVSRMAVENLPKDSVAQALNFSYF